MNWDQFKDPVSYMCPAGTLVASQSLTQGMVGSNLFTVIQNILVTEFIKFNENI